jgi:hypothetical protein
MANNIKNLVDFLSVGKAHRRFSSVEDIDNFVSDNREVWADFLNSLPDNPTGGLSSEEIQTYINNERASWDDKQ